MRRIHAVTAIATALILSGCGVLSAQKTQLPETLPDGAELVDVPFFPQERYQCGPAALATVLSYRGVETTPEQLKPEIYLPGREGSLQFELMAASRRAGMVAYPLEPHLDDLLTEVAAGNPVLVLQNLGLNWMPQWHYAVVVGFDQHTQELILRSGTEKRRHTDLITFSNTWARSDNWALVITPPAKIPVTASPSRWLKASLALSDYAMADAADALDRGAKRWPERSELWLASGNVHYSLKNYPGAARQLEQGLKLHPASASLWNNYGYTLSARQCGGAAVAAVRCAVALEPGNISYQQSLNELMNLQGSVDAEACPTVQCVVSP